MNKISFARCPQMACMTNKLCCFNSGLIIFSRCPRRRHPRHHPQVVKTCSRLPIRSIPRRLLTMTRRPHCVYVCSLLPAQVTLTRPMRTTRLRLRMKMKLSTTKRRTATPTSKKYLTSMSTGTCPRMMATSSREDKVRGQVGGRRESRQPCACCGPGTKAEDAHVLRETILKPIKLDEAEGRRIEEGVNRAG